ncbi:MAG: glycosyltransferase [Microbacterium sp.]|uniref:glycosyltransferase n=1 Tax=Microbacterium sp. TaxID=51671 RepID=UPI0026266F8C|nr:glycosyltransferase [Microbacterium sp.]MCX6501602.1 glycosyltransferase [Microbacterium sp.]
MNASLIHLMGELRPSGMERMLASSAAHWPDRYRNAMVVGQGSDHSFASDLEFAGYDVRFVPKLTSFRGMVQLWGLARSNRDAVWNIHVEREYAIMAVILRSAGARRIVRTVHNVFPRAGGKGLIRTMANRVGDRCSRAVVAVSDDVAIHERAFGRRTTTILNWVDDRFFEAARSRQSAPDVGEIFALVGNCSSIKNHEFALSALPPEARLIHLGDETNAAAEEIAQLDDLEKQGRLIARGVKDPARYLAETDIFLMPSLHEGMGVALAEATVSGCHVLAADSPGLRWSRGLPGVELLPLDQALWRRRIREPIQAIAGTRSVVDLLASRGTREYAKLYDEVVRQCTY